MKEQFNTAKCILITGSTGFIGRNIIKGLCKNYIVYAPPRNELDVVSENSVDRYLKTNHFDVVIHCANISPAKNTLDKSENMLDYSVRGLLNLERHADNLDKIIYFGSGAEYNKKHDIHMVEENNFGDTIPTDAYGFAKYILNKIARDSTNIYNMRLFGCYGPTDAKTKFIRDAIDCCLKNTPITIKQNCLFDYLFVSDLVPILTWFIENTPAYHDYNICTGRPVELLTIAKIIATQMACKHGIVIAHEGLNREYTASNKRLLTEIEQLHFTTLDDGIAKQIEWQRSINNNE